MQLANLLGYLNFILPACSISCAVGDNPRQPVLAGDHGKQACTDGWPVHTSLYWLAVSTRRPVLTGDQYTPVVLTGSQYTPACNDVSISTGNQYSPAYTDWQSVQADLYWLATSTSRPVLTANQYEPAFTNGKLVHVSVYRLVQAGFYWLAYQFK